MIEHHWEICGMCGPMVVCGACGNNSCNGGYGEVNGVKCEHCPSAYEMMLSNTSPIKYYVRKSTKRKQSEAMWGPGQGSARKSPRRKRYLYHIW